VVLYGWSALDPQEDSDTPQPEPQYAAMSYYKLCLYEVWESYFSFRGPCSCKMIYAKALRREATAGSDTEDNLLTPLLDVL